MLVHLKQAQMHTHVHARGDDLDLQALPGQGVLVVPIATVRSDAPSVPEGVGRSSMASSVPERTLHQRSSRSARASSSCPSRS